MTDKDFNALSAKVKDLESRQDVLVFAVVMLLFLHVLPLILNALC